MDTKVAFARASYDEQGIAKGSPEFKQGSEEFKMDSMYYNFDTKKAKIYTIITQQQDGFLHGESVKRMPDNVVYISKGKYTTCDAECPHYYLSLTRAKMLTGNKIIMGPSYFVLADVPMPLGIPFGYFPTSSNRSSGILIPTYGEETTRGFYFREGGFYLALNDYFDLTLTGSIYTLGSKEIGARSNYYWRYHFSGNFNLRYAINQIGEKGTSTYREHRATSIQWTHSQDPKFSPNKTFSASVNYTSSSYRQYNETTLNDALTNTTQSSVSYSQSFPGTPVSLSVAATHSHNTRDSIITLGLPTMSINVARVTPFKRKERVGELKWYENIGLPLSIYLENKVTAKEYEYNDMDNLIQNKMRNGLRYNTSLSVPFTVLKFFNLTPAISYNGRAYLQSITKTWVDTSSQ
jgi:lipopolysaccharide assembly outer membrane protein LptD (OstA)